MEIFNVFKAKRRAVFVICSIIGLVFFFVACGGGNNNGGNKNNNPPTATLAAAPVSGTVPLKVVFSWQVSDPDNDDLTCSVDVNNDGKADYNLKSCSNAKNQAHTYTKKGNYTVKLTVTDGKGGSKSDNVNISVSEEANKPPAIASFNVNPTSGVAPLSVAFSWQVSDPNNDILTCSLDINSDGKADYNVQDCGNTKSQTHTYVGKGNYTAKLTVTDGKGGSKSDNVSISVSEEANQNPLITSFNINPKSGVVPLPVVFSWDISDPNNDTLACAIDVDNNGSNDYNLENCTNNKTQKHTYKEAKSYTAKLIVTDDRGGISTKTQVVMVDSEPEVKFKSCLEILNDGSSKGDGIYQIDVDGNGNLEPFEVYCNMTNEGGGWTLYANHSDGIKKVKVVEKVDLDVRGVLNAPRWRALRDGMTIGMLFIDEHDNVSTISADKLRIGSCKPLNETNDLTSGHVWYDEDSGCSGVGQDYSVITISDEGDHASLYLTAGAAVLQLSSIKFDRWPYQANHSFDEHDQLYYFIK